MQLRLFSLYNNNIRHHNKKGINMRLFNEVQTVGELKSLLQNIPDETVLFQTNHDGNLGYRKQIQVMDLEKNDEYFGSFHKSIKKFQCLEDKIRGTHNNLERIVIFGS